MTKLYKIEVQTTKQGQVITAPMVVYEDENSNVAALQAETAFHQAVAYNLQQGETLDNFLVAIMTEVGYINPELKKFYNFAVVEPTPEPEPTPNPEPEEE